MLKGSGLFIRCERKEGGGGSVAEPLEKDHGNTERAAIVHIHLF